MVSSTFDSFDGTVFDCFIQTPSGDARNGVANVFIVGRMDWVELTDESPYEDGTEVHNSCILRGELESYFEGEDSFLDGKIPTKCIQYKNDIYILLKNGADGGLYVLNKVTEKFEIVGGGRMGSAGGDNVRDMCIHTDPVMGEVLVFLYEFHGYGGVAATANVCAWDGVNILSFNTTRFNPDKPQILSAFNCVSHDGQLILYAGTFATYDPQVITSDHHCVYLGDFGIGYSWASYGNVNHMIARDHSIEAYAGDAWGGHTEGGAPNGYVRSLDAEDEFDVTGTSAQIPYGVTAIDDFLWVYGQFEEVDGVSSTCVAKYSAATGWLAVGMSGVVGEDTFSYAGTVVRHLLKSGGVIYACGTIPLTPDPLKDPNGRIFGIVKYDETNDVWVRVTNGMGFNQGALGSDSAGYGTWMCEDTT